MAAFNKQRYEDARKILAEELINRSTVEGNVPNEDELDDAFGELIEELAGILYQAKHPA